MNESFSRETPSEKRAREERKAQMVPAAALAGVGVLLAGGVAANTAAEGLAAQGTSLGEVAMDVLHHKDTHKVNGYIGATAFEDETIAIEKAERISDTPKILIKKQNSHEVYPATSGSTDLETEN